MEKGHSILNSKFYYDVRIVIMGTDIMLLLQ